MSESFYITTPIYYVNDIPHIGHAYTTIACDVMSRYKRMKGCSVYFLTGTDEHGQKIQQAAQAQNITPQELTDRIHLNFRNLWGTLNISNNDFIRTTSRQCRQFSASSWHRATSTRANTQGITACLMRPTYRRTLSGRITRVLTAEDH